MFKWLLKFALSRPVASAIIIGSIVSAIYGAGAWSGAWIEHRLEASARAELQAQIIELQDELKIVRDAEMQAQADVREANDRLESVQSDLSDLRDGQNRDISDILEAFTGRLNASERPANCRIGADDVSRMREFIEQLSQAGNDQQ